MGERRKEGEYSYQLTGVVDSGFLFYLIHDCGFGVGG